MPAPQSQHTATSVLAAPWLGHLCPAVNMLSTANNHMGTAAANLPVLGGSTLRPLRPVWVDSGSTLAARAEAAACFRETTAAGVNWPFGVEHTRQHEVVPAADRVLAGGQQLLTLGDTPLLGWSGLRRWSTLSCVWL